MINVHRIVGTMVEYVGRGKTRRQFTHDHPSRSKLPSVEAGQREAADTYFDHIGELVVEDEVTGEKWLARVVFERVGDGVARTADRGRT